MRTADAGSLDSVVNAEEADLGRRISDPEFLGAPKGVVRELEQHVLLDGFRIVVDLEKSRGCFLVDAVTQRALLDFYGFYGSMAVGFQHPAFHRPEVQRELFQAARSKVANSSAAIFQKTSISTLPRRRFGLTFMTYPPVTTERDSTLMNSC